MPLKKVLIIAGGTGGHIFPALTIAHVLKTQGVEVNWLGAESGMEQTLVGDQYPLHLLPIRAIRGKGLMKKCLAPWRLCRSIYLALQFIKKIKPDLVIGMGGYASGPGGIAAWLLKVPLVIHEQNAVAGLTNRLLSHVAAITFSAFPNVFPEKIKAITVGNPVRQSLTELPAISSPPADHGLPLRVLVLGGSQGARAINQAILTLLPMLDKKSSIEFWHQTGVRDLSEAQDVYASYPNLCYRVASFISDMNEAYSWADLVICRAGALTVSELAVVGKGSILIPFPYAVDDHQTANANNLVAHQAGVLLPEKMLTAEKLYQLLTDFVSNRKKLMNMAENARVVAKPHAVQDMLIHITKRIACV